MYQPDGLLTLGSEHDVGLYPCIIAPDPCASAECLDVSPSPGPIALTATTMGDDDTPSGLNGRLRPRKSLVQKQQILPTSESESKVSPDKQRRTSTPSKASPNKYDDLVNKSEFSPTLQFLCPYCDKKFVSKQTVSKHARRMHLAVSKQGSLMACLFCNHAESNATTIIRHMVDSHPNQYFACFDCNSRFLSTSELAEHKLNGCEKQKVSYRSKLRQKIAQGIKKKKKSVKVKDTHNKSESHPEENSFKGIVISCELKPSLEHNPEDIEDNITTNLILPPSKSLGSSTSSLEKSAVIILDDIQWNKRIPPNFTFHNTDADQILSRLGVVHKSPRTGESTKKDWLKSIDESSLKFEKCFDTTFYSKVSSNVQENLSKFLDGSFNFNPDPESVIKTRKSKKSVVINTAEGFPILLACEQYSRNIYDGYLPRSLAPRHKWIRDNIENERSPINPDQIKRDSHVNNCIITLVSGLDIWTQLCMRRKFEDKNRSQVPEKKVEKRTNARKELEDILESRELPSSSQVEKPKDKLTQSSQGLDFPASLGLVPSAPSYEVQPAVLSGEWVRPRCYVCCACGAQTRDPRTLTSHIATRHPNAQVQHYEIVGEVLLNADILKHLYIPPSQISNRTRPLRGFRECTKCMTSISLEDLHQHMLDCAGDTPAVRRRQGRRPFGVRRRRPRLADNTVRRKIRKDIRTRQRRQKNMIRPRQKIRTEVGDAETIRKMLADLPAKRHRVLINPLNHMTRPRVKKDNQKKKIMMKKLSSDDKNIKDASGSKDNTGNVKRENNNPNSVASKLNTNDDNKSLRSKISRVVVKSSRQSQRVKRNANMSRIKRKSVRLREQQLGKKNTGISHDLHTELSNDDSLKKMDIKGTGYKTREHANRTGSNNCGEQKQGCSRSNNNSNNSVEPIQSVPLKHSIARLTANSETHDKSVQFHHLFLVQQECNNVNHQHMPSEERTLFENEDVIVRFDKPPLNFCQKSSLDFQKNKISKPRKGLNDCIAMLRHKLLDPVPSEATGHVSVQCGGDEPLDFDVPTAKQTTPETDDDTLRTDPAPSNRNLSKLLYNSEQLARTINEISEENENSKCSKNVTVEKKGKDVESKKDSPKEKVPEKETFTQRLNESSNKIVQGECIELNLNSENSTSGNNYIPSTTEDISSQNTLYQDSFDNSFQISTKYREFETTCKNNTSDCEHLNKQAITSENNESMITSQKDVQVRPEIDSNQKLQVEIFSQPKEFENMPPLIPPAHASTNVAPMLTIPLDLSSKLVSSNNQVTVHENYYSVESYDDYETLDLSNKTSFDSDSINNDDVVDLRVKTLLPEYQHSVDLCVKSCIKDTQNLKDFSDNIPTDLSVKGKGTDARSDNCQYDKMLLVQDLSSHSKIFQESRLNPSVPNIAASQNCPTDLSSKTAGLSVSNIEQNNINIKDVENSRNIQNSLSKINASIPISTMKVYSQTNLLSKQSDNILQLNQNLEAVHSQKSNIYDSALVIPQYKIKATSTKQTKMPDKTCVTDSLDEYRCSSNNVPNIITSSSSLGSFTKTSVHMSVKSQDSFGDTLSSTIISKPVTAATGSLSDTEGPELNCAPLCISSSSSVPISTENTSTNVPVSSCQSTIGTTVVSSTTIYTTSVEVPSNYKTCLENKVMTVLQKYRMDTEDEDISTQNYKEENIEKQKDNCTASSSDQDPETARKIAMLPKELVEIIGNMPADHRNQLLNVLPQYVSTSSASCVHHNETEKVISLEETLAIDTSQIESNENKGSSNQITSGHTAQESAISKQSLPSPKCSDQIPQLESPHALQQFSISPTNDKIRKTLFNTECVLSSKDDAKVNRDHHLEGPYMPLVLNTMSALAEYDKNGEKTIDLTNEENSVLSTDAVKVVKDLSNAVKLSTLDITTFSSVEKPERAKIHSEKTASLRAVRIKAPAERQKENQLLKRMSVEQQCKPNISDPDENEVNKSLESNTSLAIQQAEISSTQSNKNVQPNINNEPESNSDESLRSPMDILIENKDINSHKKLTKSAVVTSSIAMNDTTREDSNEINVNKALSNEDIAKELSDDTAKSCVKEDMKAITINPNIAVEFKQKITKKSKFIMETKKRKVHTQSKNKTEILKIPTAINDAVSDDARKKKVHKHTKNKTEISESITAINDDDSEDDISLALILKQKKKSVKKMKHKTDHLPNDTNAVLAKTDKELDNNRLKTIVYDGKAHANKKEIMKINKRTRNFKNSVCESRVLAETANVVNQNSKNKTKKRYNIIKPAAFEKSDTIKNIKEKIAKSQPNVINTSEQGNKNVMLVDHDVQKSKLNVAQNKSGTVQESTEMEMQKHSTNDNSPSKSKEEMLITVQKGNINKSVTKTQFDDRPIEQERVLNESISSVLSTVVLEQDAKCFSEPIKDSQLENIENKKVKLSDAIESNQEEVINKDLKTDDYISTPLRRSRRGKSLYTENITDSVIPSDTSVDHKTPLTKKQLIFSKLQLDEETLAKQKEICQNKDLLGINAKINEDSLKNYEEKKISSLECTSKILIDTVKGTKRRKTHQTKGKSKMKKSSDSSLGPEKDNSDLISKSMIDTVTEPNSNEKQRFDIKLKENKGKAASENHSTRKGKQIAKQTEKREYNTLTSCDGGHIGKPKKKKLKPIRESKKYDQILELDSALKNEIPAETKIPVAARRTRSKSVIVKSLTSDSYDPYNIDFDDISEKAVPFRKALKQMKVVNEIKEVNQEAENDCILTEKEVLTVDSEIPISTESEKQRHNFGKFKTEPLFVSAKYDEMIINENICHCDAQNVESKRKTSVENPEGTINEDLSDSDDSSKSDVPLKKYLEGKEKRMIAEKDDNAGINTEPKKKQDEQKITVVESVSETEEQLRSEQFMESFGFFSERKPRKSNLLAAKKISETFHIIANENDDIFCGPKQRMTKKISSNENKKNDVPGSIHKPVNKTTTKKSKKNKNDLETGPCYCYVCKKTFYRPDNYLRHQMTLLHISKLSEVEMKVQTNPIIEEPNYLVAFRDQINRLKELALKLAAEKKKKNKIKMPSLDMILDTVNKIIKKQKLQQRGLSTDQALFLDCCELLKESHKSEVPKQESIIVVHEMHDNLCSSQTLLSEMDIIEKTNDGNADTKSECDSITAKSILESEEVRNLENDLISGLKEAAKMNRRISKNIHCQQDDLPEVSNECCSTLNIKPALQLDQFDQEEAELNKSKKNIQSKRKMYPDVEDIDIFEDKFDKIKRKCRSQAAAAKQTQCVIEASPGHKIRKKIDTKKGKRVLKKNYQSTVLTKGALKEFDGIKVSIPTSDITVPGINVSLSEVSPKKKKRKIPKKNREKKDSESSTKYDSDSRMKEGLSLQRKHDVYEFMDNEDAELFEFRPSTLMERFKSIHSKEYHSKDSPKLNASVEDAENTSESGSDEDDFVYMSDDYVCSDEETENSLLSCEISNLKTETKKIFTPPRRKDVIEKNAVMGKIFKHNAVRSEKKEIKTKESDKPKTNLDQLFDSLLEGEPVSSKINNEESSLRVSENEDLMSNNYVSLLSHDVPKENLTSSYLKNNDSSYLTEWEDPSKSKQEEFDLLAEPSTSKGFAIASKNTVMSSTPKVLKNDKETNDKFLTEKPQNKESQDDICNKAFDETGVARQRARRKCTVGKQNVLAETWSSESEPDGVPIRSNSAESLVITASRKKKGKKREGNQFSVRRGSKPLSNKKQDDQSRVSSSIRKNLTSSAPGTIPAENLVEISVDREIENKGQDQVDMQSFECVTSPATTAQQGLIVVKGQPRSATSYWSPAGATEQEHIQQHGWIVGDSHKKLVTMLAHAKGRKRHNDDERHLIE